MTSVCPAGRPGWSAGYVGVVKVMATWLDGFDIGTATRWELPALGALAGSSAVARLDNGMAYLTGLTGEHLATGLDPNDADRQAAVDFDPGDYSVRQRGTARPSVFRDTRAAVFDPCYFNLAKTAPTVQGVVDWGAHDPGGPRNERPEGLAAEVEEKFGAYPARQWLYATPWASPDRSAKMGADLCQAVRRRSMIARWLMGERLTDWDFAFVGVSEAHTGSEGLFHGADPEHPMAGVASAAAAGDGLRGVFLEIDQLVADLLAAFPEVVHVVFTMHGMGPNDSDVASMVLLGELMRRWAGDDTPDVTWPLDEIGVPELGADESWVHPIREKLGFGPSLATRVTGRLPTPARRVLTSVGVGRGPSSNVDWMPLTRHQPEWHRMRAFAIPSFYDGRVRLNVKGREATGLVDVADYQAVLDEIEGVLRECRDSRTGRPAVASIDRPQTDSMEAGPSDADLVVHWNGMVLGLDHPQLGRMGPFPPRRTGGHTNPYGACFIHGPGIEPTDLGTRSSFDVVPTLFALLGQDPPWTLSGSPMPVPIA